MLQARVMGNYVQQKAASVGLSMGDLCKTLDTSEQKVKAFLKGRAFLSFNQLSLLAEKLDVSVSDIMSGDPAQYDATVVHCMNDFDKREHREFILDLIDDYMDILDSVEQ